MALGSEVIDLMRSHFADQSHHAHRVGQIAIVQLELSGSSRDGIGEMVDPLTPEAACPPDHAMDFVPLFQQELSQVRAVLSGDAGDQCAGHGSHGWHWEVIQSEDGVLIVIQ